MAASRPILAGWTLAFWCALFAPSTGAEAPPPNVLLIILDDQNAFAGRTDLAPQPVTPKLDRFAQRGVTFSHAYCAAPLCNPSRTALLSGLGPSTTGIYHNSQGATPEGHLLRHIPSLPGYFRQHGYLTAGGGKVFGSSFGSVSKQEGGPWDETMNPTRKGRMEDPPPPGDKLPLSGLAGKHDWGAFPESREQMADWKLAGWAAEFLSRPHPKPFFLACGIVKPHTPWYVPQEYFDLFPPNQITVPDLAADENVGLPAASRTKEKQVAAAAELRARRKELMAAYLAASRYADDCVGRILAGLENGPFAERTIVVICGDNGYQFGEKNAWSKGALWEGSTRVPLVISGPGVAARQVCPRTVGLIDLYPTLLELAGLPAKPDLDGVSLVPLLKNPVAAWDRLALSTMGYKNHAIRDERWRLIQYADGSEELYDHQNDPLERRNLAPNPEFAPELVRLRACLPQNNEPQNPNTPAGTDD